MTDPLMRDRLDALGDAVTMAMERHMAGGDDVRWILLLTGAAAGGPIGLMVHDYPTETAALPDLLGHVLQLQQQAEDAIPYGGQL